MPSFDLGILKYQRKVIMRVKVDCHDQKSLKSGRHFMDILARDVESHRKTLNIVVYRFAIQIKATLRLYSERCVKITSFPAFILFSHSCWIYFHFQASFSLLHFQDLIWNFLSPQELTDLVSLSIY